MKRKISSLTFAVLMITICFIGEARAQAKTGGGETRFDAQPVYWYERAVKKKAWMSIDEVAVLPEKGEGARLNESLLTSEFHPRAGITKRNNFAIYLKSPDPVGKDLLLKKIRTINALRRVRRASPVFYPSKKRHPDARMVLTGQIIVQYPHEYIEAQILQSEAEYGLERVKAFGFARNTFLYDVGDDLNSLEVANRIYESGLVIYAYPNWLRGRSKRFTPNDPLFANQWHLENAGQGGGTSGEDVNIVDVWDTYQGSTDEVVAIVDDGLEIGHEDLSANVISGQNWDWVDGDSNPTAGDHGTSCGGVAAGRGNNNLGVSGAAPLAGLVGHRLLGAGTDANEADAMTRNYNLIDIYSNSWGPVDDGRRLEGPGPLTEDALEDGGTTGRGGLGNIYVWAGGNGEDSADNSNYDGYANSRYTIAVASSTNYGEQSWYSEQGANILVNSPSNGGSLGITTTDRTGGLGYDPGNYTATFGGTSSSTPLVAGILALVLESNPNLTWRDIQHILLTTAQKNHPSDPDWLTNGAGYDVNHKYGFGRLDAEAAVDTALTWSSSGPEVVAQDTSSPNLPIPDNNSVGVSNSIQISEEMNIEFVEIYFSAADHTYWGDLEITLTSPDGTRSTLSEPHSSGGNYTYNNWRFGSVRHFGESSQGTWTLTVKDLVAQDTGTFQSWTLAIYGTAAMAPTITDISFDGCISELCTSLIRVTADDPAGGDLTYSWEAMDGGSIIGGGDTVAFDPPGPSIYPSCDSYQVRVTVSSSASGLSTEEIIDIYVRLAGDADGSGIVNVVDKVLVRNAFGQSGDPGWIDTDVNCDGSVNIVDKVLVRNQFGQPGCGCLPE